MIETLNQSYKNQRIHGLNRCNNMGQRSRTVVASMLLLPLALFTPILVLETSAFSNGYHTPSLKRIVPNGNKAAIVIQSSGFDGDVITSNTDSDNKNDNNDPAIINEASSTGSIDIELEQQINQGLQRAKEVLQKSKAKLAAMEQNAGTNGQNDSVVDIPFFATRFATTTTAAVVNIATGTATATVPSAALTAPTTDSSLKVKSRNSDTGLVTADGERMAEISEYEPWEYRSIYEMFQNNDEEANSDQQQRVEIQTDVMASIQNLRKVLQTEDYRKIFDPRNRFIGEDN